MHEVVFFWGIAMMLIILILMQIGASQEEEASGCSYPQRCGDIKNISYPFSLHQSCGWPEFLLDCQKNEEGKEYLYLNTTKEPLQVLDIHPDNLIVNGSTMQLNINEAICNDSKISTGSVELPAYPAPYVFSDRNTFITWNCGMGFYYTGIFLEADDDSSKRLKNELPSVGGCISDCSLQPHPELSDKCTIAKDRNRIGINEYCCSTDISTPSRALSFQMFANRYDIDLSDNSTLCSASAVAFFPDRLDAYDPNAFPLRIDWAIPYNITMSNNKTEQEYIIKSNSSFACSDNSNLTIVSSVPGYRCACLEGYSGDGYKNGNKCTDVNECEGHGLHKCAKHANCQNRNGNYTCSCKSGFIGDGFKTGSGCNLPKFVLPLTNVEKVVSSESRAHIWICI